MWCKCNIQSWKRQMVEWKSHVAAVCNGTTAASAKEKKILPKPSKARLDLLVHVHVNLSCSCSHICPCGQSDLEARLVESRSSFIVDAKTLRRWCVRMDLRHKSWNELPSYLFIQALLSITAIIRANLFRFWENEGCIPSNFQFGSGHYGHDECLNSPSFSAHFS